MPTLESKMREYARSHQAPVDDTDWDQMCGSLMHRFNTWLGWAKWPTKDVRSAQVVANGSGWLNPDRTACPAGGWHYFSIAGLENGHVSQEARGGGRGGELTFMATWSVGGQEELGQAIGFLSVAGYLKAKAGRATYLGWATNYGGGEANLAGLAALTTTTLPPAASAPIKELDDMKHIYHPERGYAIIGFEGAYGYKDAAIDAIAAKGITASIVYEHAWQWDTDVREANIRGDALRALQTKHTLTALRAAGIPVDFDEAALAKQIGASIPTPTVDSIAIAKATADEMDARDRKRLGK